MQESKESNNSIKLLNERIKSIIHESLPNKIKIIGEVISSRISNNHQYVIIKDDYSDIHGVIWNVSSKNYSLEDGNKYEIYGIIDTYTKNCSVQINIINAIQLGLSNQHKKMIELKSKLQKEGIFDKVKKQIPKTITNIGILTSLDSASLTDILSILMKNNYKNDVIVKHCMVQGKQCVESVVQGIKWFDDKKIDVLIITRGGGSDSDLSYYSDEMIIRAIYNCEHPVISAIGHERDNVLCDEVADVRVSTPSNAGQLVSKIQQDDIKEKLQVLYDMIINRLDNIKIQKCNDHKSYNKDISNMNHYIGYLLNNLKMKVQLLSQDIIITSHDNQLITSLKMFNKYKNKGIVIHFADGEYEL